MTKKTRTILFSICLFSFLISAPLAVFYSQGYRFDFNSKRIVKTGAFYFKVWPRNVEIYLDGKSKKKTDFFFGSALIENLMPKKYQVQIKKAGYLTWEKKLEIKEGGVTEAKNIFLVPENPKFQILVEKIEDFFFSPDGKKIILKERGEDGWILEILELEINKKNLLFEGGLESQVLELSFSPDSKRIFLKIEEKEKTKNLILDLEGNLISLDFLGEVEKISFNPKDSQKIFFVKENFIFEADLAKKELTGPILKNLITYEASNSNFYWLSKDGYCFKTDFSGKIEEKINFEHFSLKEEKKYQISLSGPRIFLKENDILFSNEARNQDSEKRSNEGSLYLFDFDLKSFQKFFEPIRGIEFSPDGQKMVYFNNYEIWVLFLEDILDQPQKQALEQLFLTRFSEKIDRVFWYTSNYLIFNTGSKIKIVEIDDRDRFNIFDFGEFQLPKIFFNRFDKKLYLLSEGNFLASEKLLP